MLRTYQSIVVIDSLLKSEEIDGIIEKVERIISNNGGKINELDRWGKKRLAYEIKKRQYGYYVEFLFDAPNNLISVLDREYGLDENILRYLTIHLNARALEQREQEKLKRTQEKKVPEEKEDKVDDAPALEEKKPATDALADAEEESSEESIVEPEDDESLSKDE
ncbi:30S ribosomal protein S6 [candidate division KSB1 bacterium 4572_119]|nr:MAG: 30S ribosomal protein S6 [candidate division KSB1 bacterium 4572_119]